MDRIARSTSWPEFRDSRRSSSTGSASWKRSGGDIRSSRTRNPFPWEGLVRPYLIRAAIAWLFASLFAAAGYYIVRRGCTPGRAALHGLAASLVGLLVGWLVDGPAGVTAFSGVLVVFGIPAVLRALFSRSRRSSWVRVMAAWTAAAVPAAILTAPWF